MENSKRSTDLISTTDGSFHEAIASILVIAQCFGVMPVVGVTSKSASNLKFQLKTIRAVYSFIAFLFTFIHAVLTTVRLFSTQIQFDKISMFSYC